MEESSLMMKSGSIEYISKELAKYEQPECPVVNYFDEGVYVREVTMPKDSIVLGKKHKDSCINIISKGSCLLVDIATGEKTYIEAPYTFISKPGVQKLAYILEEVVWSNVHTNIDNEQDLDVLEERIIEKEDYNGNYISRKSKEVER